MQLNRNCRLHDWGLIWNGDLETLVWLDTPLQASACSIPSFFLFLNVFPDGRNRRIIDWFPSESSRPESTTAPRHPPGQRSLTLAALPCVRFTDRVGSGDVHRGEPQVSESYPTNGFPCSNSTSFTARSTSSSVHRCFHFPLASSASSRGARTRPC